MNILQQKYEQLQPIIQKYKEQFAQLDRSLQQYLVTAAIVVGFIAILIFFIKFPSVFMILIMLGVVGLVGYMVITVTHMFVKDFIIKDRNENEDE